MDIEALLDDAAVLLDLTETSLERIIHTILTKTLDILDAPLAYEEAMTTLFLPESGNILAKTIQVLSLLKLITYKPKGKKENFHPLQLFTFKETTNTSWKVKGF